ncbi:MAG: LysR substrate-binding domain-containing protein, partial [Betaproteobacteria bacterium]
LGQEVVAPYVRPGPDGEPLFRLPGAVSQPLPYLGYAPGAYLGQMVELILKQSNTAIHFDRVYETDMAEGLKAMALEGHGVAFLPYSAVQKDLAASKLVAAAPAGLSGLQITMDVRAYRERPSLKDSSKLAALGARAGGAGPKRNAQALWDYLLVQAT